MNMYKEMYGDQPTCETCVDASACKGMLLRLGTGRVSISAPSRCGYGAVQANQKHVIKLSRDEYHGTDALAVAEAVLHAGF